DTATIQICALSLHDALPISSARADAAVVDLLIEPVRPMHRGVHRAADLAWRLFTMHAGHRLEGRRLGLGGIALVIVIDPQPVHVDRKSTRLNSSHVKISYAV